MGQAEHWKQKETKFNLTDYNTVVSSNLSSHVLYILRLFRDVSQWSSISNRCKLGRMLEAQRRSYGLHSAEHKIQHLDKSNFDSSSVIAL